MIANYYLMITELSKIQLTQDDYGDKKKVKLSNRAAKTLQGIEKEMQKDLEWFTDKFDYRNADAPWKNSKDALPRTIQKTNSINVEKDIP